MNDDFTSLPPPDDDNDAAHDPLLRALRQHLGEGFGQEPSAQLWAGIRGRLPAARPWWRRRRFLLPLLALLLVSTAALWQAARLHRAGLRAGQSEGLATAAGQKKAGASRPTAAPAGVGRPARPLSQATEAGPAATTQPSSNAATATESAAPTTTPRLPSSPDVAGSPATAQAGAAAHRPTARPAAAGKLAASPARLGHSPVGHEAGHTHLPTSANQPLAAARRSHSRRALQAAEYGSTPDAASARYRPAAAPLLPRHRAAAAEAAGLAGSTSGATRRARLVAGSSGQRQLTGFAPARPRPAGQAAPEPKAGTQVLPSLAEHGGLRADSAALLPAGWLALLAGCGTGVVLPRLGLPAPLAAGELPGPWLVPGRRWAVQVLAGPTASYRVLRQRDVALAATFAGAGRLDSSTVGLERVALGWGAQVQLRRVLAGRWALAAGMGYQEYATRLALDVTTYSLNSITTAASTTTAVRQRDTYRLLTLPVQLTYQLGPRGPWRLGVLGGAEPSLYLGGRTTENSGCDCQQQTFTSASGSPYRSLSLALSLGLDARYRLGGPAGRWWLLAQPTGRYVATPFVRSDALYYAQRQPYSLGLLLGTAWEW